MFVASRVFARCAAPLMWMVIATSSSTAAARPEAAQSYPDRPIRIVAPNSPGSGLDVVTRLVGNQLMQAWGKQVVIDNRAGASGSIGTEIVARAAPDGYTLLMLTSQQAVFVAMHEKLPYDLVRDFSAISLLASAPYILVVNNTMGASSINDLVAIAKSRPGQLNYGSAGSGSSSHLAAELFRSMTGITLVHVPYKGTTQALTDTIGGQLQITVLVATAVLPAIRSGKVKALGISSAKRSSIAPEIPTIAESVTGYEWSGWYGLVAPRGTPGGVIAKLNAEQIGALKTADFQEKLSALGADPIGTTPQEFASHIRSQVDKMRVAIKISGARPD
jgi:tripartite-type tricarboxylate transporter receptor subunit TctC